MTFSILSPAAETDRAALLVCAAATVSLAVAMGIGRFAFTPLFPLMVRDGLLDNQAGGLLAASNYLGYLVGALAASRLKVKAATLLAMGLIGTAAVTAAVGWTASLSFWAALRFTAGVMSAWALVATSAWGLGWLVSLGRPQLAGALFAGVGLGIAAVGGFCLFVAGPETSSLSMWVELGFLAAVAALIPLVASWRLPGPVICTGTLARQSASPNAHTDTGGLIACYTLFGFGYILPATYLPVQARQLIDDPQVFGWAWPLFGAAAVLSTVTISWGFKKANRLSVWAASHLFMAVGVLLLSIWSSLVSVVIAALLVGGTFMVITMLGMQEARARAQGDATVLLGKMTAGFAFGQLMGPAALAGIGRFTSDYDTALRHALAAAAAGLVLSAFYLWRKGHRHTSN